jgi:hypothetical protein
LDKETLKRLSDNPNFISGVYNYCDRWCERCPFTSRCMNYSISQEELYDPDSIDVDNPEFTEKIFDVFKVSSELLTEMAEEHDIDLTDIDTEEYEQERKSSKEAAKNNTCSIEANKYTSLVKEWFESSENLFLDKEEELNNQLDLNIAGTNPVEASDKIKDSIEVILWYQHQIYVKIMRALNSKFLEVREDWDDIPKDSDGSAKVALIGIENSIIAWELLNHQLRDNKDSILDILIHLDRLRNQVDKEFPDARKFIRPGLDEPEKYSELRT